MNAPSAQTLSMIDKALAENRFETARRLCLAAPNLQESHDLTLRLHEAYSRLGDIVAARKLLQNRPNSGSLEIQLLLAEDYARCVSEHAYRLSEEAKIGLCFDEFVDKYRKLANEAFENALRGAETDAEKRMAAESLRRSHRWQEAEALCPSKKEDELPDVPERQGTGVIHGKLSWPDGSPAVGVTVTLGLEVATGELAPEECVRSAMHYLPEIARQQSLTATTDADGTYQIDGVPAGSHEFLAATLRADQHPVHTRFFAHNIDVEDGRTEEIDWVIGDWQSAPPESHDSPFPAKRADSHKVCEEELKNPFFYDFPRQATTFDLPNGVPADANHLSLYSSNAPEREIPYQIIGNQVLYFTDLPAQSNRSIALYQTQSPRPVPATPAWLEVDDDTATLNTGVAQFRIPFGSGEGTVPPLLAVKGVDHAWRGNGRWILPDDVVISGWSSKCIYQGPLACVIEIAYTFNANEHVLIPGHQLTYKWTLTAHRDEAYILVHEASPHLEGVAVEFSLAEFTGGRHYLHWCAENGQVHWSTIGPENKELARLQESVAWWIPPQGFGSSISKDSLQEKDYLSVFTIRRGEWVDRLFERISQGPGDENRELDWPYPEMVGSTVSMITTHSSENGDVFYRWKLFDGERRWGFLASSFDQNDGHWKELSAVQHKTSSPRLQDFKDWKLDTADNLQRPSVVTGRESLLKLKARIRDPRYAQIWGQIEGSGGRKDVGRGLTAILKGDPLEIWALKKEIAGVAHIRSRMTLLGREYSDMYSPVGARPITPWAEIYDLIAPTGVFTADEERLSRSFLMLMGHMYMQEDLMNWRYNSRNANFEADRVDVVGAVGLAFRGNSDADAMIQHSAELMQRSLETYCTPGSGKWYENPACYYLHAAGCRLNLAWHLYAHNILDSTQIPRLRDFLSWGPNILTPRFPHSNELLIRGCSHETFRAAGKARRIPPIGDHAHLGQWVSDFFAIMGKAYENRDPEFANFLKWAYSEGGRDGGHFGRPPLYFAVAEDIDLDIPEPVSLESRRLEGFGSVFRGSFGRDNEFYLLFKLGPGGYRYHRTEGSIILFADGKPLVYDGGEAGETWRHSTLSFGETHMPLAAGHIERFSSFDELDFSQGVNPKALMPGEPVFLSDTCEHELVEEAFRRYAEPNPENSRSCLWVKDEYVIMHDQLRLPTDLLTHWHIQVVADDHDVLSPNNYRFAGRYGTDLQVVLPNQDFTEESVTQTPILEYRLKPEDCFSMRHLQLSSTSPGNVMSVLRPLPRGKAAVTAHYDGTVLRVQGQRIDDVHILDRNGTDVSTHGVSFKGRYGSILQRPTQLTLALIDGEYLSHRGLTISSSGPSVCLSRTPDQVRLSVDGEGEVTINGLEQPLHVVATRQKGRITVTL